MTRGNRKAILEERLPIGTCALAKRLDPIGGNAKMREP